MKAVTLTEPGHAAVMDVAEPSPNPSGILLRVKMVGLCGTDLNSFRGMNPMATYPLIIGHEIAATIVEGNAELPAGSLVTVSPYTHCGRCPSCRRGRINACQFNQTFGVQRDGAMTQWLRVPPEKVFRASLGVRELCLVEPLSVGMHAVSRGAVATEDNVAVYGCGGVGLGAIAGAAFRGATTIAIDVNDEKLETARAAGATYLINSRRESVHDRLQEITDGSGPDVVIEAIGLPDTFRAAVEEVAFTGRIVYVGYAKESVSYESRIFVQKELDIRGSRNALPEDFVEVIRLLESGRFPVDRAISAVVPMDSAPEILALWSQDPSRYTKILVEI